MGWLFKKENDGPGKNEFVHPLDLLMLHAEKGFEEPPEGVDFVKWLSIRDDSTEANDDRPRGKKFLGIF